MRPKNVVKINYVLPKTIEVESKDSVYIFEKKDLPDWVYNLAWKFLKRLGFKKVEETEYVPSGEINTEDVAHLIRQNATIVQQVFQQRPAYLFLGEDAIRELKLRFNIGAFNIPPLNNLNTPGTTKYNHIGGMQVILVPWMKGALAVHDFMANKSPDSVITIQDVGSVPPI